jgi:hypothetical protein
MFAVEGLKKLTCTLSLAAMIPSSFPGILPPLIDAR